MAAAKRENLPEIFVPDDPRWASRAAARGEIRRLVRGLYSTNLDEPVEHLVRRRWYDIAALYFPGAVVVDRSAVLSGPASDGSLFLDSGPTPAKPRTVVLPGLTLRPRPGPGPVEGDIEFASLHIAGPARTALDNTRPSRERKGVRRTLRREEQEERLDRLARIRGNAALNELRDEARAVAPTLEAEKELADLERLIGALLGTRDDALRTRAARARRAGLGYDSDRLRLFEALRSELARQEFPRRAAPEDPERWFAFFEAYFSNWIEGTIFEVAQAEEIVFGGTIPVERPADAHDIQGTFEVVTDPRLSSAAPSSAEDLESYIREAHRRIMSGRPEIEPGEFKHQSNRSGATVFVHPDLVRGTLREGFTLYQTLALGMPRAIFAMFLIAEIHPFADGNGRVARTLMNAELSAAGMCRVMVPLSYRDEYMSALRALSHNENPRPLWRMIERAQRWAAAMTWSDHDRVLNLLEQANALVTPERAHERNLHLLDPM
jgi:fido (protein-threonine AMPylation protein)